MELRGVLNSIRVTDPMAFTLTFRGEHQQSQLLHSLSAITLFPSNVIWIFGFSFLFEFHCTKYCVCAICHLKTIFTFICRMDQVSLLFRFAVQYKYTSLIQCRTNGIIVWHNKNHKFTVCSHQSLNIFSKDY